MGYPRSGKSLFVDLLYQEYTKLGHDNVHIVRPSDWYPDDIDTMPVSKKTEFQIASWEHALDKSTELIASKDVSSIIILDTCGASPGSFRTLIGTAQLHNHKLAAIFMAVPKALCMSRIDPAIVQRYSGKIRNAVLEYKSICDELIIIRHGTLQEWQSQAELLAGTLKHQPNQ